MGKQKRHASASKAMASTAPAGFGEGTWEQRMVEKIRAQPKWGSKIATPKAEDRMMAGGKRFVVLPNPRLQVERVPAAIHGHTPPRFARAKRTCSLSYDGEAYHFE